MVETTKKTADESETELVERAQVAVNQSNWIVGECAAKWTKRYARGRTDAEFGNMVGLSGDQVYQRRRVWETFGDVVGDYSSLRWSHFYISLNWDDAPECLQWAEENQATVAEMRAWRRAVRGDDLTTEEAEADWESDGTVSLSDADVAAVRDPDEFNESDGSRADRSTAGREPVETVAAVARESDGADYSPFRKGAGAPAPKESSGGVAVVEKPRVSAEQVLKRAVTTIERLNVSLTPEVLHEIRNQPDKMKSRLMKAINELTAKVSTLQS